VELVDSRKISKFNGNKLSLKTIECLVSTAELLHPRKMTKVEELSTITVAYMENKYTKNTKEKQKLRVLFDSGCGATLGNKKFVKNWEKTQNKSFHKNRKITCNAYVDDSPPGSSNYDMIIERALMHSLEINLLFDTAEI
jgi:hypothetical protein